MLLKPVVYQGTTELLINALFYHKLTKRSLVFGTMVHFTNAEADREVNHSKVRAWQDIMAQELAFWVFGLAKSCTPR